MYGIKRNNYNMKKKFAFYLFFYIELFYKFDIFLTSTIDSYSGLSTKLSLNNESKRKINFFCLIIIKYSDKILKLPHSKLLNSHFSLKLSHTIINGKSKQRR